MTQQLLTVPSNRCCNGSPDAEAGISLAAGEGGGCGVASSLCRPLPRAPSHCHGMLDLAVGRGTERDCHSEILKQALGSCQHSETPRKNTGGFPLTERAGGRCHSACHSPPLRSQHLRAGSKCVYWAEGRCRLKTPVCDFPALLFTSQDGEYCSSIK